MKILITETGYITESHEKPIVGRRYWLEDDEEYTQPMRNLWESLVDIAYKSGTFDYDTIDKYRFREHIKKDYGEGFNRYKYVDDNFKMVEVKSLDEIPEYVLEDFNNGNSERILGVMKSTTAYTKKRFSKLIDNTINAMQEREIDTPKFRDIIETITKLRNIT